LTVPTTRTALDIDPSDLACAWESLALLGTIPPSWAIAQRLFAAGTSAVVVPSFAPGALAPDRNVVFWRWAASPPHQVKVIDDDRRLPSDASSWL
jgi:RES domain-containing protein